MRFSVRHPRIVLAVAIALVLLAATGVPRIEIDPDLRSIVGDDLPEARAFFELQDHGAISESLFVTVDGGAPGRIGLVTDHARRLEVALRAEPAVRGVSSGPSKEELAAARDFIRGRMFLFLPPDLLDEALARCRPEGIDRAIREARAVAESAAPLPVLRALTEDPLGFRELLSRLPTGPRSRDGFLVSDDGAAVLLVVTADAPPTDRARSRTFLRQVRSALAANPPPGGITVRLAGGYLFAEKDAQRTREDLIRTVLPSLLAVVLLFWLFFRGFLMLLVATAPVVVAAAVMLGTLGYAGVGMTPLAMAFCALLIGLGVDFGLHLLFSVGVAGEEGAGKRQAILAGLVGVRRGILLGGLTTACALSSLALFGFPGLAEFGIVLAFGVLVAMAASVTVGPALLAVLPPPKTIGTGRRFAAIGRALVARRKAVGAVALVLVLGAVAVLSAEGLPPVRTRPEDLRPKDDPPTAAVRALHARFARFGLTELVVWRGTDVDEGLAALHRTRRDLESAGLIRGWSGPDEILNVSRSAAALKRLAAFDPATFLDQARAALARNGLAPEPFRAALESIAHALGVREPVRGEALLDGPLAPLARPFVVRIGNGLRLVAAVEPSSGKAPALSARLAGGDVLLTGARPLLRRIDERLGHGLSRLSGLVLVAVVLVVLVGLSSLRLTALAVAPVVLGSVVTLAAMRVAGIDFNMATVGLVPMLLGLGVDDGIQFVSRLRREGDVVKTMGHVGGAVVLTTLTTCAGFGSLVFSTSPALAAMGILVAAGSLSACASTLLVLPVLAGRKGRP